MTQSQGRLAAALADRYAIAHELGAGGMATVYLAEDLKHSRKVAIKVLREDLAASMGATRFLREIQIAAQLQHPNILPLLDSGEADGLLYFVMPYVPGQSLRERLAREGELPVHEAVRLLCEITDALSHAHQMGVVHRDVKPDNVMLSGRHALVTDFGVAKAISEATGRTTVTTLGVALGTPAYMSPEQAAADPLIDHRSDIYAVGVMAYEMLTGRPPFTGATPQQVLAAHVTEAPDPVAKRRPAISPALDEIVMRCLAKRPADRHQTAEELLHLLEAQATPSTGVTPTQTRPTTAGRPAARRQWIAPLVVGIGAALVAVLWWRANRADTSAPVDARHTQVTFNGTAQFTAALSNDGRRVAYADRVCGADYSCTYDLVVQDVGGSGSLRVLTGMQAIYEVSWSGDDRTLLVGGLPAAGPVAYYSVPTLGGEAPRLISSSAVRVFGSADSALIAAQVGPDTLSIRATTLAAPERGEAITLTEPGLSVHQWSTSPSGRWIVTGVSRGGVTHATLHDRTGAVRDRETIPDAVTAGFASDERLVLTLRDSMTSGMVRVEERRVSAAGRFEDDVRIIATGIRPQGLRISPRGIAYLSGTTRATIIALDRTGGRFTTREVTSSTGFLSGLMGSDGTYVILERADPADPALTRLSVQPFEGGDERLLSGAEFRGSGRRSRTVDGSGVVVLTRNGDSTDITEVELATGRSTSRGTMSYPGALSAFEAMQGGGIAWQGEENRAEIQVRSADGTIRSVRTPNVVTNTLEDSPHGHGLMGWGFALPNFDTLVVYHVPPGATEGRSLVRAVFDFIAGHRWLPDGNAELVINETLSSSAFYHLDVTTGRLDREATIPINFIEAISFSNDGNRVSVRTATPTHDVWLLQWEP